MSTFTKRTRLKTLSIRVHGDACGTGYNRSRKRQNRPQGEAILSSQRLTETGGELKMEDLAKHVLG